MSKNNIKDFIVKAITIAKLFRFFMLVFVCNSCTRYPNLCINNFNEVSPKNIILTRDSYFISVPCVLSIESDNIFNDLHLNSSLLRNTSSIYIDTSPLYDDSNILIIRKGANVRYIADVNVTIFTRLMYGHGWHDFSTPVNSKLVIYQQNGNEILLLLR